VDPEPRTDILSPTARRALRPAARALSLAAGLAFWTACGGSSAAAPPDLPAIGGQVSVIRVPRGGGIVEAYAADSLRDPIWTARSAIGPVADLLGVNLEDRLLLAVDSARRLVAVDLESRGIRQLAQGIRSAVFVPDGSVYAVDDQGRVARYDLSTPTVYRPRLPGPARFRTGTLSDRFVAVTAGPSPELLVLSTERRLHATPVPEGEAAATWWGDLVAVASGSDVALFDTDEPFRAATARVGGTVQHLTFSPSGHRLYASTEEGRVVVIDRFTLERVGAVPVPGQPSAIRTDGSGRWLLARSARGDSAWVVDLATGRLVTGVATRWGPDLPTVAGAATLLVRTDGDVVARDLSRPDQPETGRVAGGSGDLWQVSTWLPREQARLAARAAESVLVAQDSLLVTDSATVPPPADELYLQVSSSQNQDWSRELARQLTAAGYPARVFAPGTVDDGYRVVVGPYPTREEAEDVGRQLGRPYFVLTNPRAR
jgi:DNA-binding beta-propeller fold protein YncE